ncbi:hypothetical protein SYNTR_0256 [Candidatus Syntrophocurvum alkaliphilum]|uniref:Uncharacterized protein n=1 Tax=Candidatus Syntrophocurvum alkaliphilum TaxID=2293317 RepID=A0A6I6DGT4_9FIRM|nr:hypothetical protein SYNTR_0256 [Candidatus Syntrophocurvum alkaliphilum]
MGITILRLFFIHLGAFLAIIAATYFSIIDIILSFLFVFFIWHEAKLAKKRLKGFRSLIAVTIWQMPGLIMSLLIITNLTDLFGFGEFIIFLLQFWHMPILPLLSILPAVAIFDKPLYYYGMLGSSLFIIGVFIIGLMKK